MRYVLTSCHYSAGVGCTGTYVALDNVLDQIEAEGVVDIDGVIVKARNQRMKMVQTMVSKNNTVCESSIMKTENGL